MARRVAIIDEVGALLESGCVEPHLSGDTASAEGAIDTVAASVLRKGIYAKMKILLQITGELCTGPEQLMNNFRDQNSVDIIGGYIQCLPLFDENIVLTRLLIRAHANIFGDLGVEVMAEAQNGRLEMLLETFRDSDTRITYGGNDEVVNSGRDLLSTLNTLLVLSSERKVELNSLSVQFRIAASNHNLAMFCIDAHLFERAYEFSRDGILVSDSFVSAEFGNMQLHKYVSMHAALLSVHAQCLHMRGQSEKATEASSQAIKYASTVYNTVNTEKNIYCGELFNHYLKRVQIVGRDVAALKDITWKIEVLRKECHIELNDVQRHFISGVLL